METAKGNPQLHSTATFPLVTLKFIPQVVCKTADKYYFTAWLQN
jgi:hypothetical protein